MCQEMFHASFSSETLINEKCPNIGDFHKEKLVLPLSFLFEMQENYTLNKTYTHLGIVLYKRRGDKTYN